MTRVAVVGGARTPFVKAAGVFAKRNFIDLGIHAVKAAIARSGLKPEQIEEVVFGTVLLDPRAPNWAREIVIRSGLPLNIGAHSVSNNCISGLVAAQFLKDSIVSGRVSCGIAGGSESMSRPTLTFSRAAENLFLALSQARSTMDKIKLFAGWRPRFAFPVPPSPKEPSTGMTMGQHCEITTQELGVTRKAQDEYALNSHKKAAAAAAKHAEDIEALDGVAADNLVRGDTTIEKLAKLKPVFERSEKGTLTAGNSSSLTDGASAICLMSEEAAKKAGKEVLAYIDAVEYAAIPPKDGLLMAPCFAVPKLLKRAGLKISDIDLFEIHEAFAAQVLANRQVWESGWNRYADPELKIGSIPEDKVNVNGGSLALGHPFAATGARIILSLAKEMKRRNAKRAVISVCAAGGMACAMLLKRD
jgi:acetyl-CoA acetyltransferase family protein